MDINELGEFGLINRLTSDIKNVQNSTLKGVGDDAAIIRHGNSCIAVSTDTLVEDINFDLTYTPLQHLGYKAAIAGFSDIYAMNSKPQQLFVSISVSSKFSVEALESLYCGIKLACERHKVDLAGGDTASSVKGLIITVTAIGEVVREKVTYRSTAQKGDLICVTGNLGAAFMGLKVLEREKKLFIDDPSFQPQLEKYAYIVERQLKPEARRDIIEFFESANLTPTSMIDISDGLSPDLLHICNDSHAGCEIHHHKIPIAEETVAAAEEFFHEPLVVALNGGDDYELLFTAPLNNYDKIAGREDISIIGYITEAEKGCCLVSHNGERISLF